MTVRILSGEMAPAHVERTKRERAPQMPSLNELKIRVHLKNTRSSIAVRLAASFNNLINYNQYFLFETMSDTLIDSLVHMMLSGI